MKILATDLDRTLIPNGNHKKDESAYKNIKQILRDNDISVIYVTGRRKEQIISAMKKYDLPKPIFCVANVGTEIFKYSEGRLTHDKNWENELKKEWKEKSRETIKNVLKNVEEIWPQEETTSNQFKQSYYADVKEDKKQILDKIKDYLEKTSIPFEITYSIDANRNIAQIDVMPPTANKKNALSFVLKEIKANDVIVSGDSGNDLAMLTGEWKSVLVKNAKEEVKKEYFEKTEHKKSKRYIADGKETAFNGNYAAGILEAMVVYGWIDS